MKNQIIGILSCLIIAGSCSIDMYKDNEISNKHLTLFAFLTTDSTFSVHLSKSVEYYSVDDFERVYDGFVVIEKNDEKVDSFAFPYRYLWAERNAISIRQNDKFKITASDTKGNVVSANTIIPQKVPIESVDTSRVTVLGKRYVECKVIFQDPPEENNYYQLIVTMEEWGEKEGKPYYSTQQLDFHKTDSVFFIKDQSGSVLSGIDFRGTFSDYRINGLKYPLKIRIPSYYVDNVSIVEKRHINFILLSLTSDYFNYVRSRVIADYNYDLPIIDPVKIHGNVEGGLGLVGGIALTSSFLVFKGSDFKN